MNEQDLVLRAKRGDQGAFEQLVLNHQNKVYSLALRLTGDREEAADLRGDDPPAAPVYTAASPLWLAAPWESLYLHWLQAEILYFQAEYGRYENARAQFNSLYLSWHAALIRGARPRGNGNLRF